MIFSAFHTQYIKLKTYLCSRTEHYVYATKNLPKQAAKDVDRLLVKDIISAESNTFRAMWRHCRVDRSVFLFATYAYIYNR